MGNPECQSRDTNNIGHNTQNKDKQNQKHITQKRRADPQKTGVLKKGKQIMFLIIGSSLCYSYSQVDKGLVGDGEKQIYVEGVRYIVRYYTSI